MSDKPFNQACDNNKDVILAKLTTILSKTKNVLEIGSGTGQHAVHFAAHMPHLWWQTADQPHYHQGINAWIDDYAHSNIGRPLSLTLPHDGDILGEFDGVYTANTAHIMQQSQVQAMMELAGALLPAGGVFCQYGPFTQGGQFSTPSNRDFHQYLLAEGYGGYRDIEELQQWAPRLTLSDIINMPANNLLLVWHAQ